MSTIREWGTGTRYRAMKRIGIGNWSIGRVGRAVAILDLAIVLVVGIHLAGGAVAGADNREALLRKQSPVANLGLVVDDSGCTRAKLQVGDGTVVYCRDWSAIEGKDGRALVVSLYGPDHPVVSEYQGPMPQKLHWGESITEVMRSLGKPTRITSVYGTPTLVYTFDGLAYGSLELRFSSGDRLKAINACLTH